MARLLLIAAAAAMAFAGSAAALTLTNRDQGPHALLIVEDDDAFSMVIQPGQVVRNVCPHGCTITVGERAQQRFEGDESVFLEGGELVVGE